MKITKNVIKQFEQEQEQFGTKVALYNLILELELDITDILHNQYIKALKDGRDDESNGYAHSIAIVKQGIKDILKK
jgi:hypothetical protein